VETKKALKIEVEEEEAQGKFDGTITAINKKDNTVTVTIRAKNGIEATYKVTPSTKLDLDGAKTYEGLKIGMKVEAKVHRANNELVKLELED
jgi:hypothetical protein